jgi:hypothetical protein
MNGFPKVLVVDDGERAPDDALSAELAGLGYASVTASFEAAEDVLAVIPTPAAILLQLPRTPDAARHDAFRDLADRLKARTALAGIPVLLVEPRIYGGAYSGTEQPFGAQAVSKPDRS